MTQKAKHELSIDLEEDVADADADVEVIDEDEPMAVPNTDPDVVDEDADLDPEDRLPDHAVRNQDGSVTLPLMYPRTVKTRKNGKVREREFKEFRFHRLTGADQRAIAAASEDSAAVVAFARSTKTPAAVMNALFDIMDAYDIACGGRVLSNFTVTGPRTGRQS